MRYGAIWVLLAGCAAGSTSSPAPGTERGACLPEGECARGLECWSDRCVTPPPADCDAVGARLASEKVGNYAAAEERAPWVEQFAERCRRDGYTAAEGDCIAHAADLAALDRCPRTPLPGVGGDRKRCAQVAARAADLMPSTSGDPWGPPPSETDPGAGAAIEQLCIADAWSPAVKDCALAAQSFDEGRACADLLPPPARARALHQLATPAGAAGGGDHPRRGAWAFAPLFDPFAPLLDPFVR